METPTSLMIEIDSILRLFRGPLFPRTVSTYATEHRQVLVNSMDEIIDLFDKSNYIDCRINAYPVYSESARQSPDLVMADLDPSDFKNEPLLIKALNQTVINVAKDLPGNVPMVLFTGNGYHVYQPIDMPILEEESIFRFFDNPSTEFIRYAARRWTEGKNDACNKPSVKSCLLRVPGSINSKNLKTVETVQEWNGKRPAANRLLQDFYIKSAAKRLASQQRQGQQQQQYYNPTSHHFTHKTYRHSGHMPRYPAGPSAYEGIAWIDSILGNGGIADHRKVLVDLVLAPYLVNIKQCGYNDAYNKMVGWLNRCSQKRRLDFNARFKVRYALNRSKHNGIRPMRLDTMKESYSDLYQEVFSG